MSEHRRLLTMEEVLRDVLPIGRTKLYGEIRASRLKVVKIGRRTFIGSEELDAYLKRLDEESI